MWYMMNKALVFSLSLIFLTAPTRAVELQAMGGSLGFCGVSGQVGNTYLLRLYADLGPMMPDLHLVPDISRWSWSKTEGAVETVWTSLFLGANSRYFFPSTRFETIKPYVGGGLGLHLLTQETIEGGRSSSVRDFDLGLDLMAGGTYLVSSRIRLTGEARYTLVSRYSHLSLTAGAAYLLYD